MWKPLLPARVQVVGSFLLKTQLKCNLTADLAVEIPKECFWRRDNLNHTYTVKRAVYLSYLAHHFKQRTDLFSEVKYTLLDSNPLRPCLQLKGGDKSGCFLRIHPVLPEGILKLVKLWPSKNNIRREKYFKSSLKKDDDLVPTPLYNSSLLLDLSYERNLHILYEACSDCLAMRDAILLFKVWLHKRHLDRGPGGFNGFLSSMLIAFLLNSKKVNTMMSSYQIFRVALQFLVDSDWSVSGISLAADVTDEQEAKIPSLEEFHHHFDVVFVDSSGLLNLCADMKKDNYQNVGHEAKLALQFLSNAAIDGFDTLFLNPVEFSMKCDQLFHVPLTALKAKSRKKDIQDHILAEGGNWVAAWINRIVPVLMKGLGKRIHLMTHQWHIQEEWEVAERPPALKSGHLTFGILLDSDHAFSILDKGPSADDSEALEFRKFWGEKSEMRRFQDGSILEAVVWPCKNQAERRTICKTIIYHLLEKYGRVDSSFIVYWADQLDCILRSPSGGTGEEERSAIFTTFESFTRDLRKLTDLPLAIQSLQGTSAVFRETEVYPTAASRCFGKKLSSEASKILAPSVREIPAWCPSHKVVCHLEGSGKWPDDVEAIRRIKAAFHLKMAELAEHKCRLVAVPTQSDVKFFKDGFVFRLSVANDREISLLRREDCASMADTLEKEAVLLPLLTSTLRGLHARFPPFSMTARLAKRWISAQLLSPYVSDECVELLVAQLFLSPAPYSVPGSGLCGFQRFLSLLSCHDWERTPLLVNLNDEFKKEDFDEIATFFADKRDQLPPMFIATPRDKTKSMWTCRGPSPVFLYRLVLLASEALKIFKSDDITDVAFKQIFRPSLDDFDVVIRLKSKCLPRLYQAVGSQKPSTVNGETQESPALPVCDFNPATEYLADLEDTYGDVALFFHDPHGGSFIAVVWKPDAVEPQPFKISSAAGRQPDRKKQGKKSKFQEAQMVINKKAIIEDFKTLGTGLVDSIDVKTAAKS
eukprot:m.153613 g.153613  ORF g.153613 m.153613 type:complete len:984 (+) comp38622_c1_seq1:233-3184(+)